MLIKKRGTYQNKHKNIWYIPKSYVCLYIINRYRYEYRDMEEDRGYKW